jgi:hypothetical protein
MLYEIAPTPAQQNAWQAYLDECHRTDTGSHGAILRVHTPREQELWDIYQESLKTPLDRLHERIRDLLLDYWREQVHLETHLVHVSFIDEETNEVQRSYWIAAGDIAPDDRLFEMGFCAGWPPTDYVKLQAFVVLRPGSELTLLQICSTSVTHDGQWYMLSGDLAMPDDVRAEVQAWFTFANEEGRA